MKKKWPFVRYQKKGSENIVNLFKEISTHEKNLHFTSLRFFIPE